MMLSLLLTVLTVLGENVAADVAAYVAAASAQDPSSTYNFLTLADWGNDSPGQVAAAAGLGDVAAQIDANMVFLLGDNFYGSGIHTTSDGGKDGPNGEIRIKKTFEDVYTAPSLKDIPFYAIAGNHDHNGNVTAQIHYTNNSQNVGGRWKFPYWYHNVTKHFMVGGKSVELEVLLFDSVVMVGNFDHRINDDGTTTEVPLSELQMQNNSLAEEQLKWLTGRMENSTADYLWVGGHYPVWAIGQDKPTGVRQILRDLLNKWEANYFNGHEHDFEHIVEEGSKVNYICTGAGYFCCYSDTNLNTVPQNSIKFATSGRGGADWYGGVKPPPFEILSGFTSYRVGADSMTVYFHAHNGTVLYVTPPILPRTKKPQPPVAPPAPFCSQSTCPHTNRPPPPTLPTPPTPPTPPPPTPQGMVWECHDGMSASNTNLKLKDADLAGPPFGEPTATVATCESACDKTKDCVVVNWHEDDKHCHTMSGAVTHGQFVGALQTSASTACMLVRK
jgi:hypothetical protein